MSDINVIARTQHLIVDPASKSVSVISAGTQGPPGPPGIGGTADTTLVTDVGDWFVSQNVEDVLQEIGANLDTRDAAILDHEVRLVTAEGKIADNDLRLSTAEGDIVANADEIIAKHNEQVVFNSAINALATANSAAIVIVEDRVTAAEGLEVRILALENGNLTINATLVALEGDLTTLNDLINNLINEDVTINGRLASIEARLDALENPNP